MAKRIVTERARQAIYGTKRHWLGMTTGSSDRQSSVDDAADKLLHGTDPNLKTFEWKPQRRR